MKRIDFIERAKLVHLDKYDYSLVVYINNKTHIDIICSKHGVFSQAPNEHLRGSGCPRCGFEKSSKLRSDIAKESFIGKALKTHNSKYEYSLVIYNKSYEKVIIGCPIHGIFKMSPNKHLKGHGCPKCKVDGLFSTTKKFIDKAKLIHSDKYDYSLAEYITAKTRIDIICKKHGIFKQKPNDHLSRHGCPKCCQSSGEQIIGDYLDLNKIEYIGQYSFYDCKNIKKLIFDFYLPEYNMCIEYDGIQHYESNVHFGGDEEFHKTLKRDEIKDNYCIINNIKLYRIKHDENIISEE